MIGTRYKTDATRAVLFKDLVVGVINKNSLDH